MSASSPTFGVQGLFWGLCVRFATKLLRLQKLTLTNGFKGLFCELSICFQKLFGKQMAEHMNMKGTLRLGVGGRLKTLFWMVWALFVLYMFNREFS